MKQEIPSRGRVREKGDIIHFLTNPCNALFTLVKDTKRRTYKVNKAKDGDVVFVNLLIGQDNTNFNNYHYIGLLIFKPNLTFRPKKQQTYGKNNEAVSLSYYFLNDLISNILHKPDFEKLEPEFWHEGKCARCGKKLTVPESIKKGMGAICLNRS